MFSSRTVGVVLVSLGLAHALLAPAARATLIWSGDPTQGTTVFKLLNLENSSGTSEPNPSPNGSFIAPFTDPTYGPEWEFSKAAADLRAEAHGAAGFDPAIGNTYYLGWRFEVNSTVTDNAVFQWKAYGDGQTQDYPIVLKFVNGDLQLHYFAPGGTDNLLWSKPETADQWNAVALAIHVDDDSTDNLGSISFWWNGTEQDLASEGTTYFGRTFDGTSVDPKWGIYGAVGTQVTNVVNDLKIGTTYADVAPSPVPEPAALSMLVAGAALLLIRAWRKVHGAAFSKRQWELRS
jgi:hypothetical protein